MGENGVQFDGVQREYDWEETPPMVAVLESIAVLEFGTPDRTTEVLDAPFNDYIDADGLEKIVQSPATTTIEFTLSEYEIKISGNQVRVSSTKLK